MSARQRRLFGVRRQWHSSGQVRKGYHPSVTPDLILLFKERPTQTPVRKTAVKPRSCASQSIAPRIFRIHA
eukprot:2063203-Prymnesium_polylepis.1